MIGGNRNKVFRKMGREEKIVFDGFSLYEKKEGQLRAVNSKNCQCANGTISCGLSVLPYKTPSGIELNISGTVDVRMLFPLRSTDVGVSIENLYVLYQENGKGYARRYLDDKSVWGGLGECSLEQKGLYALDSNGNILSLLFDGSGCKYQTAAGFFSSKGYEGAKGIACYCKNRVFVATGEQVISYTDPNQPTSIENGVHDGGFIVRPLDGDKIVALHAKDDTVYVFYRKSILKMEVGGIPQDFVISPLPYIGGEIFGRTVTTCGKWIVFLASDGIYRFDGKNTERICAYLGVTVKKDCQLFGNGLFSRNVLISYEDANGIKRTVAVDPEQKTGYYTDFLPGLTECDGRTLCFWNKKVSLLEETGLQPSGASYSFESEQIDFGSKERKSLKGIRLKGEGSVMVTVQCDKKTESALLFFNNGEAELALALRGHNFSFRFNLTHGSHIEKMEADVTFVGLK